MKFKYGTRRRAAEYEKAIVDYWKKNKTFEKSIEQRPIDNSYVFYDGPPFITGNPHHGTLLSSIVKDAIPRYQTMKGKRVERVWGWDCHGLPAENFTEKHLGGTVSRIAGTDKLQLKIGDETSEITLEEYITTARSLMVSNSETWESTIDRIGRWVDFKGAYKTMDKNFMESVWWAFKQLHDKGKIYEGERVLMYDTKFATPVSKNEVTMDNDAYQTVTDPSVFVKFKLKGANTDKPLAESSGDNPDNKKVADLKKREVVRGIISDENGKIALLHSKKYDYYDLPGGGVEYGEDKETALVREMKEELGLDVEVQGEIGHTIENHFHRGTQNNSHGFYGRVIGGDGKASFQEDEVGEEFETVWADNLDEALRLIAPKDSKNPKPQTVRDTALLNAMKNRTDKYLLAWTTTPWTLPGNTALAVNEALEYAEVELDGTILILAKKLLETTLTDEKHHALNYKILRELSGKDLVGLAYEPLFATAGENAQKIYSADYVEADAGTGIVHIAPAYGEVDFELAQKEKIPVLHAIDDNGYYLPAFAEQLRKIGVRDTDERGIEVWAANKFIAKCLEEQGIVWKIEYVQHEYPFNPRSKQRIMYRAIPTWFFDIQGQKPLMLAENENINWFPEHLKHGRFQNNIDQAPDWNLSRNRFWATAMPVWKGDKGTIKVVGSYEELEKLSGQKLEDYHRPWVDQIEFDLTTDSEPVSKGRAKQSSKIKAVIFDYSDVIGGSVIPHFFKKYPDAAEQIRNKFINEFDYGTVDYDGMCEEIAKLADTTASVIDQQMHEIAENLIDDQKLLDYILDLRKKGYKTGLLSNTGPMLDLKFPAAKRKKYFDDSILSCEVHMAKPSAEIYELSAKNLGVKPEECIFIDDSAKNIDGAEKVGMKGVLFDNSKNGIAKIKEILDSENSGKSAETEHFTRVPEVLDCWFESGSMPFAQLHYPFENKEKFEQNYPADFIVEYIGQVRAWFYYVHTVNTALFGHNAYKNVITTGVVAGNDGRKMSKSLGNFTDPNELMDKFSADSLRFLLLSSPLLSGDDFALIDKDVSDIARKLSMIWNMYDFFTMYAEVDGWEFDPSAPLSLNPDDVKSPLDKWIISRIHQLTEHITKYMDEYNLPDAMSAILPFVDDASNWYVRRSRRRFWKSEDDADKNEAYRTLHYVLVQLAVLLAPFTPFLSEELYQQLTGGDSVHLLDWPKNTEIDQKSLDDMALTRQIIEEGLRLRMDREDGFGQIKVRQPLNSLSYGGERLLMFYEEIVKDEVNIKHPSWDNDMEAGEVELDKQLTPELKQEGFARELIRYIQNARKSAGLQVDDRIKLSIPPAIVEDLPSDLVELIKTETLALELTDDDYPYAEVAKIDGQNIPITLEKA